MCGRFTLKTPLGRWLSEFFGDATPDELPELVPRYNIAPTQSILVVHQPREGSKVEFGWFRWGLIPSWADDLKIGNQLINARLETIAEKPSFRHSFAHHRGVVLADGYYEWRTLDKKTKQPFWIHRPEEKPFCMAAVSAVNSRLDKDQPIRSVAMSTTDSRGAPAVIHHRMPVILWNRELLQAWLSGGVLDGKSLPERFVQPPEDYLQLRPVGPRVGNPRHDAPDLLNEVS